MERNIPHVLDIFVSSPGERRRILSRQREEEKFSRQLKDQQKNPGTDSAVCLCSSSDEDEKNISKYFEYLDEDDDLTHKKRNSKPSPEKTPNPKTDQSEKEKQKDPEKDIKQIERHLSMKKTIRKKMMRDLQQAFVEDPKEFQQDPEAIPAERKNNINIHNLTISKKRLSKSEHSFLDMLKENEMKDRKTSRGLGEAAKSQKYSHKRNCRQNANESDSGNDSPTREPVNKPPVLSTKNTNISAKEEKKTSFWQRLTGKGKNKR